MLQFDIVIIGGGPAGMAAAVSAYDHGVKNIAIIDRDEHTGGILQQCIHNGFGLHKLGQELTGPEYAAVYSEMVLSRNIAVFNDTMVLDVTPQKLVTASNRHGLLKIQAKSVILAMGCRERSRGALNICGTRPAGVFSAGTAQKLINCEGYKVGKRAVILGSGDIGLIMARRLSLEGAKVEAVCEIMPYSGGLTRNIVQCLEDFGIPLYLSHTVAQIHGKERLEGVTIAQVDENRQIIDETRRYIPCDTLLLSCGLIPENELTQSAGIAMDRITNGAIVDEMRQTQIPGIFACGNVLHVHDLVDYVSEEAELAGIGAAEYVLSGENKTDAIPVQAGNGIRYCLPQRIHTNGENDISLYMRLDKPYEKITIKAVTQGNVIAKSAKLKAAPGEMEKLVIKKDFLPQIGKNITVFVEEKK